jgi:hypothetical protein
MQVIIIIPKLDEVITFNQFIDTISICILLFSLRIGCRNR